MHFQSEGGQDWEWAFVHGARAAAERATGDHNAYAVAYRKAEALVPKLSEQDAAIFNQAFRHLPKPSA